MAIHPVYRYRSFAERLGPKNAKNIILHYVGVIVVVYVTLKLRSMCIAYSEDKCVHYFALPPPTPPKTTTPKPEEPLETTTQRFKNPMIDDDYEDYEYPKIDLHPYWSALVCNISGSRNFFVRMLRNYVRFSSYYFTLSVGVVDTAIMILLAKHLWRALWLEPKTDIPEENLKLIDHHGDTVSIEIGEDLTCMDDNFVIEVILAALDFFRVSEPKQD